ncbi:hypothetical protein LJC25_03570 [Bacteroidales bacterium OttesenSCG-928-K03]|nr:hypothetical protein [Odoribacter sp. OttesenSCG-928-L07]MDL2238633.1 hypothetical protein [Bacteroidales bacterium OttesenSCG-928-L14]MDL2240268.1 hypothetical protein [Bacteroidales bacterium OttesenSCG-928-K22]MDL2242790.1 hypothetical protein [Bacteroidales bacterium OttesenSCG-928-K03]
MKKILFLIAAIVISMTAFAIEPDSTSVKKEKIKTGWNFGGLPVVSFNTDLGFQYGALVNAFNYGDGSRYPDYNQSIKVEVSTYTKGSSTFQLFYDDKTTLPKGIRMTTDLSYLPSRADHFYGFNGARSIYNPNFEDDSSDEYISRMFYRQKRNLLRFTFDLQQKIGKSNFKWLAGIGVYYFQMGSVDIDKLNKKKDADDPKILPEVDLLYDNYVKWGLINEREADGGLNTFVKFGAIYDTRDIEANPNKGIWTEVLFNIAPAMFKASDQMSYGLIAVTHRQYLTLVRNKLTFAYRLGYQGTLFGEVPYYVQPFMISSFSAATISDGLGGAKSLRGILKARVFGSHIAYGNIELRWRFVDFTLGKQNIYLTLAPFVDLGSAFGQMRETEMNYAIEELSKENVADRADEFKGYYNSEGEFVVYNVNDYFDINRTKDKLHIGYGAGFYFSMNHNFVVAINYGRAADKNDGKNGFYITIGFVF